MKFAQVPATAQQGLELINSAERFIEKTRPVEESAPDGGEAGVEKTVEAPS